MFRPTKEQQIVLEKKSTKEKKDYNKSEQNNGKNHDYRILNFF